MQNGKRVKVDPAAPANGASSFLLHLDTIAAPCPNPIDVDEDENTLDRHTMRPTRHSVPVSYRLLVGGVFSLPLLFLNLHGPGPLIGIFWLGGCAAVAIAVLAPVIAQGDWVQRIFAAILLLLPLVSLCLAFISAGR